jgi:GT2 family glycosyltransferase
MPAAGHQATISVAVASKGRPQILGETLESIARQTFRPQQVVVVVPSMADLPPNSALQGVQTIVGPLGLTVQRNQAIAAIPASVDYIAFFDDDFEASPDYLERAIAFMEANPGIVAFSGLLVSEHGGDREKAKRLLAAAAAPSPSEIAFQATGRHHILHGCNMVIRRGVLQHESFDENLPLYSYAEDYEITMRLKKYGLVGKFSGCLGAHLETPGGRVREDQRGYSLVANNLYFLRKRTVHLPLVLAWIRFWVICVAKPWLFSFWKVLRRDKSKDWAGAQRGIELAVRDIFLGKCEPGRIKEI